MANVPIIPGFYYDAGRKRYFKITTQSLTQADQKYGRENIKKKRDEIEHQDQQKLATKVKKKRLHEIQYRLSNSLQRFSTTGKTFDNYDSSLHALTEAYEIAKCSEDPADYDFTVFHSVWSDMTPMLGSKAQVAKIIIGLPMQNAILVVTSNLNIAVVQIGGIARYIFENGFDCECELIKYHLKGKLLCVFGRPKGRNDTVHIILRLQKENAPDLVSVLTYSRKKQEVVDAIFQEMTPFFAAERNNIICSHTNQQISAQSNWKSCYSGDSDIMTLELESSSAVHPRSTLCGWFGTRKGALHKFYFNLALNRFDSEILYQFHDSSILSIQEVGDSYLLVSMIGVHSQALKLVRKRCLKPQHNSKPEVVSLMTTIKNLSKDSEILQVSTNGRFILYGHKTTTLNSGGFEIFSTSASDNLISERDPQTNSLIYLPLKTMEQCFPADSLKSITNLVGAEMRHIEMDGIHFGKNCVRDGIRITIFTTDANAAGITIRNSSVIQHAVA